MSTSRTCNSSFWTKEEDKIFENTLAIYFNDANLLTKMAEALPWKSLDDIKNHYNILIEDIAAIESGLVPLPYYPEVQSDSNQSSEADVGWRRGAFWSEEEHRSFLHGLEIFGRGDWRSISRYCVKTRTPVQVASHAQKYFQRLEAVNKPTRRGRPSILDITSADAETSGTSRKVPSTNNESSHPITRIGSDFEALITEQMDKDNDINSLFDVGKAPTSHGMVFNADNSETSGYAAASIGAMNAPQNTVAAPAQLPPFASPSSNLGF